MTRLLEAWRDPDKRRAMALSVVIHLVVLFLLVAFLSVPKPRKLDHYLVITLGTPAQSPTQVQAPTVEAPAKQASQPQVASSAIGQPQARSAPHTQAQAPEKQPQTAQPAAPPPPPPAAPKQAQKQAPQQAQTPPRTAAPAPRAQAPAPALQPPAGAAPAPAVQASGTTATTLPKINPVPVPPKQPAPSILIPKPQAQAEVPQATLLAITPQVSVAAPKKVPSPQVEAHVSPARAVPEPRASASVARALSAPRATAQVTPAQALQAPQTRAEVAPPQPLTAPGATAQVAAPRALSAPGASAEVAAPRALSAPTATATVPAARSLQAPGATASAGSARNVNVVPQVSVVAAQSVPVPTVRAEVIAKAPSAGAPSKSGAPPGSSDVATQRSGNRTPGGNAPSAGQVGGNTQANAAGRGRAAGPNGNGAGSGVPAAGPAPFREELERPLAVLVDNVHGYPQSGMKQASSIIEMPVEGGLTRLMLVYDTTDPGKVGPIRSARDYFVKIADSMGAVLVHDGGSPGAMIAIAKGPLPTLDALHRGSLFSRGKERKAPYNLYSQGNALRRAVNRLLPPRPRVLSGTIYRPPDTAPTVISVTDRYSAVYKTGFRFFPKLDAYRWVRNGKGAVDASGEDVLVDAVLMAQIQATPLPDDPYGRLYIPLRGGPATLYVHGRAVRGHWHLGDGIQFVTAAGHPVDLAPFRTWIVMTPTYDHRVEQH